MKFRKKPVVIEAVQWLNKKIICPPGPDWFEYAERIGVIQAGDVLYIKTPEGTMRADVGDWIIRGVKGEIYPCKPDIFAATYDPAEPMTDADWIEEAVNAVFDEKTWGAVVVDDDIAPIVRQHQRMAVRKCIEEAHAAHLETLDTSGLVERIADLAQYHHSIAMMGDGDNSFPVEMFKESIATALAPLLERG